MGTHSAPCVSLVARAGAATLTALLAVTAGCGNGDGGGADGGVDPSGYYCDADALQGALDVANPGDAVGIGDCAITGGFTVPAGVTLAGQTEQSALVLTADTGELLLQVADGQTTVARNLKIESDYPQTAVVASGAAGGKGAVTLEGLTLDINLGVGVAIYSLESLEVKDVTISGPYGPDNIPSLSADEQTLDTVALIGLSVSNVDDASFDNLVVNGFAREGVDVVETTISSWTGGNVNGNVGWGAIVRSGEVTIENLEACGNLQGVGLELLGVGIAFGDGAIVSTTGLVTDDNHFGSIHIGSAAVSHTTVHATGNQVAAMWAQDVGTLDVIGPNSGFTDNTYRALYIYQTEQVSLTGVSISGTQLFEAVINASMVDVGDAIQLIGVDLTKVDMTDVTLENNGRAGVLLDVTDTASVAGGSFTNVTVDGANTQFGALLQDLTDGVIRQPDGVWDQGITRTGATTGNDAAQSEPLEFDRESLNQSLVWP